MTCPSADVTVRCCTARLHPLSARNLETNITDSVAYHSLFRFYVVHVYAFLLLFFCVPSAPSCFSSRLTVPSVTDRRDSLSLSRLSDTDVTGRLAIFYCPVMFYGDRTGNALGSFLCCRRSKSLLVQFTQANILHSFSQQFSSDATPTSRATTKLAVASSGVPGTNRKPSAVNSVHHCTIFESCTYFIHF